MQGLLLLVNDKNQLLASNDAEVADKQELIDFINEITHKGNRVGVRDMVDMCDLVKKYYYDQYTKGSNSIKAVLPAVLNRSEYIQKKYAQPIYGKGAEIPSLNFEPGWKWIEKKNGEVVDPYKLLPPIDLNYSDNDLEKMLGNAQINNGGAALVAYAKMQFEEMGNTERQAIISGLLKYCELDTLAMVVIYEYWKFKERVS